jgi:hypothetical protein
MLQSEPRDFFVVRTQHVIRVALGHGCSHAPRCRQGKDGFPARNSHVIPRLAERAEGPHSRRANHPCPLSRCTHIGLANMLALDCVTQSA